MWLTTYFHWLVLLLKNLDMPVPQEIWARTLTAPNFLLTAGEVNKCFQAQELGRTQFRWMNTSIGANVTRLQNLYIHTLAHFKSACSATRTRKSRTYKLQSARLLHTKFLPSCCRRKGLRRSRLSFTCDTFAFFVLFIVDEAGTHVAQASLKFPVKAEMTLSSWPFCPHLPSAGIDRCAASGLHLAPLFTFHSDTKSH